MRRCLDLAQLGMGRTAPNPLVGAVVVSDGKVLAEGYHSACGQPHAERAALEQIAAETDLSNATLYVSLEPCAHHGRTPPCTAAIIERGIRRVVFPCIDPNPLVHGKGAELLRAAGIEVAQGVLESEAREINRRFFTFHGRRRPYIIVKWAETSDGFIARRDFTSKWISGEASRTLARSWRAEESAVLVGYRTAYHDNPMLTARLSGAADPLRVVIDRDCSLPPSHHLLSSEPKTLVFNALRDGARNHVEYVKLAFDSTMLKTLLDRLFERGILSVMVEGGSALIGAFLVTGLWDEARVFKASVTFGDGLRAPRITAEPVRFDRVDEDTLLYFRNMSAR